MGSVSSSDAQIIEILLIVLGGAGTLILAMAAVILRRISEDIKDLSHTSALLNERMAVIVERVDSHEGRISRLEKE